MMGFVLSVGWIHFENSIRIDSHLDRLLCCCNSVDDRNVDFAESRTRWLALKSSRESKRDVSSQIWQISSTDRTSHSCLHPLEQTRLVKDVIARRQHVLIAVADVAQTDRTLLRTLIDIISINISISIVIHRCRRCWRWWCIIVGWCRWRIVLSPWSCVVVLRRSPLWNHKYIECWVRMICMILLLLLGFITCFGINDLAPYLRCHIKMNYLLIFIHF